LVLLSSPDEENLLLDGEALCCEDAVGQEDEQDDTPDNGDTTADEEHSPPDREAVHLADSIGDETAKLDH
jgi:hypothetical protein